MMDSIFIFIGIFLILTGLIIWRLKIARIIAGYDPERVTDSDGMARWVGQNLILMGILIFLLALIEIMFPKIKNGFIISAYLIIVAGLSIVILSGTRKYKKKDNQIK